MCLVLGPVLWKQSEIGNFTKCAHHSAVSNALWPPWTRARQASLSMGFFQARILEWVIVPSSSGSSWSRYQTHVSCVSGTASRFFTRWAIGEACGVTWRRFIRACSCKEMRRAGGAEGKTNLWDGSYSGFHHPMRSSAARKPPQIVPNGVKEAGHYNLISAVIRHRLLPEREHHLGWKSSWDWDNFQSESQSI